MLRIVPNPLLMVSKLVYIVLASYISWSVNAECVAAISVLIDTPPLGETVGVLPRIFVEGEIGSNAVEAFRERVDKSGIRKAMVYIHSPGGELLAGMELGKEIRNRGFHTNIGVKAPDTGSVKAGHCLSACVFAYVGGYFRFIKARSVLGVHRFWTKNNTADDLDIGQILSARIIKHLRDMGIDEGLFNETTKAGKDEVLILSDEVLNTLRVVNHGKMPADWRIQDTEDGLYLRGEQETIYGTGKLAFLCSSRGGIVVTAFYGAGQRNEYIAANTNRYSLIIDSEFLPIGDDPLPPKPVDDFIVTIFKLEERLRDKVLGARQLGLAFHAFNPDIYYGFRIDTNEGQRKIANFWKYCKTASN